MVCCERVSSRRGLPLIIPGPLRLQMEAGDSCAIRSVLTILSLYRVIKYPGNLKLQTITDPFKGVSESLPPMELAVVWKRLSPYIGSKVRFQISSEPLLLLRTAGPNYKRSILGASLDAFA